jgi:DNA-binding NtrC family response regulator
MVSRNHGKAAMEHQVDAAKPKHVLIVDDNVELAQAYQELLQSHAYEASVANNGVQALKIVMHKESVVDAILCDLSMPQLEGDMLYVTIQRVRPHLTERFIFLTGHGSNPKYQAFLDKLNCPVLYKPVSMDKLLQTLTDLLARAA